MDGRPAARAGATIAEVAARAGVSIATVSRVVNGVANKASPATVEKVRKVVAELGYRPESAGRALRERTSRLVAVLAANLANPTMAAIAASAEVALRAEGLVMVLCDTHDRADLQDEYLLEMRAQRARMIVLLAAVESRGLAEMRRSGETLLFVNRRCPGGRPAPFVGIDNRAAAAEAADHLMAVSPGPLAVLHGSLSSSATADRVAGFRERGAAQGRALEKGAILGGEGDHLEIGYRGMARLLALPSRPAALFCTSDLIAYGAHRRALEAGLSVPGDIAMVGFDDNPLNDWIAPWLSSVRVPYAAFGPAIAESARAIREGEPNGAVLLAHQLVVRGGEPRPRSA